MTLLLFPLWHGQLLWHYYDTIIVSIITRLWHYYYHYFSYYFTYDRVSTTSVLQCADWNPQPEHREMTFKGPWSLKLDLDCHRGALKQWKVAWRSELVLLYTLFLPLYRLLQMSDQDCCCSKGVLRTADVRAMIQCVTCVVWKRHASWHWRQEGRNCAVLWLLLPLLHYYITYWYHYWHYCRSESAWHSLKNKAKGTDDDPPEQGISFRSTRKQNWLNRGSPRWSW